MSSDDPLAALAIYLERLNAEDTAMTATAVPINDLAPQHYQRKPPAYGTPQRDAIGSVVDGITQDITNKINAIRETLDTIEQQALQSAANAKGALNDHVGVCIKLNDEITHMSAVVAEIKAQMEF